MRSHTRLDGKVDESVARSARKMRVLAGGPPIDWSTMKTREDLVHFKNRNVTIASVMEKEVLAKHRKALMLFGTFHCSTHPLEAPLALMRRINPNLTFVISDLDTFDMELAASWPIPSLIPAKATWRVHWIC